VFRRLHETEASADFLFVDGRRIAARPGDTVAAALLAAGIVACREAVVGAVPRAPYCLMGVCFDCLATIDGVENRQACLVTVRDGMRVQRQIGARRVAP
jgi:sarcosine oxidase subunit alpha